MQIYYVFFDIKRNPILLFAFKSTSYLEDKQTLPSFIMIYLYLPLLLFSATLSQASLNGAPKCDENDRSSSYLDSAVDMLTKAKLHSHACPTTPRPMDCAEVLSNGYNESGVYTIWPRSRVTEDRPLEVFCDMATGSGGWTVIQRRGNFNRPTDFFFKDWATYKKGFGDIEKDFWLGNDNIFALTNQRLYSIRFDLMAVNGEQRYALYDTFWIDDENNNYTLHIKDYSGNAGDSMITSGIASHDNQKFSAKDSDDNICSLSYKGGWWYNDCHAANLNGLYLRGKHESYADGVIWFSWKGYHESLDTTEMKIRPENFRKI